jgi:hypothetical protein
MIAFHSVLPEIAQREVRCVHLQDMPGVPPGSALAAGEYAFVEFYCEDIECDCRRVFLQVIARHCQDKVLASMVEIVEGLCMNPPSSSRVIASRHFAARLAA